MIKKITRYLERQQESLAMALIKRFFSKFYSYKTVRRVSSFFFTKRDPEKWIFLVGCYNSGTTIFRDILGMHPDIGTLPKEGVKLTDQLPYPEQMGWTRMWVGCPDYMTMLTGKDSKKAFKIVKDWSPWWQKNTSIFLEKSITNTTRMDWLDDNFKNSYFIGIVRNPYPVIEGIMRKAHPKGFAKQYLESEFYPANFAALQWVDANERMIKGGGIVKKYHKIFYEDLVENPTNIMKEVWDFLEISHIDLSFISGVLTASGRKIKLSNMNDASVSRLSSNDIEIVKPIINDMQSCLGYSDFIGKGKRIT